MLICRTTKRKKIHHDEHMAPLHKEWMGSPSAHSIFEIPRCVDKGQSRLQEHIQGWLFLHAFVELDQVVLSHGWVGRTHYRPKKSLTEAQRLCCSSNGHNHTCCTQPPHPQNSSWAHTWAPSHQFFPMGSTCMQHNLLNYFFFPTKNSLLQQFCHTGGKQR